MRVLSPTFYPDSNTTSVVNFDDVLMIAQQMSDEGDLEGLYELARQGWLSEDESAQLNQFIVPLQAAAVEKDEANPLPAMGFVIPGETLSPILRSSNSTTRRIAATLAERAATPSPAPLAAAAKRFTQPRPSQVPSLVSNVRAATPAVPARLPFRIK